VKFQSALTEDGETAASFSELRDWAMHIQNVKSVIGYREFGM